MNKLDLSAYGVMEMDADQLVEIDGGSITLGTALLIAGGVAVVGFCSGLLIAYALN